MSGQIPQTLAMFRKLGGMPLGKWLFARAVCRRAPYFASISPRVLALERGRCEVSMIVEVLTESGQCAVRAEISMYISAKKPA